MRQKREKNGYALMVELQNYEQQGISIWLEGRPSSSAQVTETIKVREGISYMRDYVFQSGELSQVRFDKIDPQEE